jgi:organic radical activating enzyme
MQSPPPYPIVEIFDSVQGEGLNIGRPATFIRFSGCNLRCPWCDTKYAWENGKDLSIAEIIAKITYSFVVLTGGEPTLCNLPPLIQAIRDNRSSYISIETNGTNPVPQGIDWVVCSPKPGAEYAIKCNPNELKYVVDSTFSVSYVSEIYREKIPIWLQPNSENLDTNIPICFDLVMKHDFLRLGVQLHKIYNVK